MTPDQIGITAPPRPDGRDRQLRQAAEALEASFLSEMLKAAGLGESRQAFGGGAGEDQFASMMRDEQARQMVRAGGIGLAETLFQTLKERADDRSTA